MKYYGIEMIGDFICQILSTLSTAGSASPEGKFIYVDNEEATYVANGTEWKPAGKTNFISLTDCPSAYIANNLPIVNPSENGLTFISVTGSTIMDPLSASLVTPLSASLLVRSNSIGSDRRITVWDGNTRDITTAHTSAYITSAGELYAAKAYASVWNDIADFIKVDCEVEYGYVYVIDENYIVKKSSTYCQTGIIGITTDTYGFGLGNRIHGDKQNMAPISIGGFVLAYVDKLYVPGTPLTSGVDGTLTEILQEDKINHPERIVATFFKPEYNLEWNGIKVNNRNWVKVM